MNEDLNGIEALSYELRKFPPSSDFVANALVSDESMYDEADADHERFWDRQARELLVWNEPWTQVCEWDIPYSEWFVGGQLNVSFNCLDRHVLAGKGNKVAFFWEGEPGDSRVVTYAELLEEVQKFANVLKSLGVEKGDRVNIYLPMIPEAAVAMLARSKSTNHGRWWMAPRRSISAEVSG